MKDLQECRLIINQLDNEIKSLFLKRMEIVKDVALFKIENNMPIFDETREKEMLNRLCEGVDDEMKEYYLEFLNNMLKISKDYQKVIIDKNNY